MRRLVAAPRAAPAGLAPGRAYWGVLALSVLALCSTWGAVVLQSGSWLAVRQLGAIYPETGMCPRPLSPGAWHLAQQVATAIALLAGGAWAGLALGTAPGRAELRATGAELQHLAGRARRGWQQLAGWQRAVLAANLLALTLLRLYLSVTLLWHDDAASYELFVQHGLLAVGAYYPAPNNHVLLNCVALGFYQLHHGFWWSMRLPVLLASTGGTVLLFAGLAGRLGYWRALLPALACSWLQTSLYHAATGRGYWPQLVAAGVLFWALLRVLAAPGPAGHAGGSSRVGWGALVVAAVAGGYLVPTFAYVVAPAWAWLAGQALGRRSARLGQQAALAGGLVVLGGGLLYAPIVLVSGWGALASNVLVAPLATGEFWPQLPSYYWLIENMLGGQLRVGALLGWLGLLGLGVAWWQARGGRQPHLARQLRQVGAPALWLATGPYLLLLLQQQQPPERVWLLKAWFGYVVLAVGLGSLQLGGARWRRAGRWGVGLAVAVFACYQGAALLRDTRLAWLRLTEHRLEYDWWKQHPRQLFPPQRPRPAPCPVAPLAPAPASPARQRRPVRPARVAAPAVSSTL